MKRVAVVTLLLGCAAPRAEKSAAPASTPPPAYAAPVDEDASKIPPSGATAPVMKPAEAATPSGGATGTVVTSPELAKAQASFDQSNQAFMAAGNDCAQLCKALGSMTNATDRLCELAGEDKRCTDARTRLQAARAKVKSTCGAC